MFKSKLIKRLVIAITAIVLFLILIKKENMTLRQSILKVFYPVLMLFARSKDVQKNNQGTKPLGSFYELHATDNKGNTINFQQFRGKKVMLVNTASDCGYTGQYEQLELLYQQHKDNLVVLAFPANDFKEQEKGTDEEIASFCKLNYGITFPLMKKSSIVPGPQQNEVFQWLTNKNRNGWNSQQPTWNFCKYLVDENGVLTYFFSTAVSPTSDAVQQAVK